MMCNSTALCVTEVCPLTNIEIWKYPSWQAMYISVLLSNKYHITFKPSNYSIALKYLHTEFTVFTGVWWHGSGTERYISVDVLRNYNVLWSMDWSSCIHTSAALKEHQGPLLCPLELLVARACAISWGILPMVCWL